MIKTRLTASRVKLVYHCCDLSMAFPLPRGITPAEIAFVAEMEMVTIVPRQRLEGLELLGVTAPAFTTHQ